MEPRHSSKILDGMSDAFMAMDFDLVVTFFNAKAERLLGKSRDEVIGKPLFESFPEAKGSIFEENYKRAAKEKRAIAFDTYFDVEPYRNWYDVRISPTEEGICVFFHTHGELRQLEQDLRKITACLLSLGNAYDANVKSLTELAGDIMGSDFAVYRALKGNTLAVVGSWNLPDGFERVEMSDKGLCPRLLGSEDNHLFVSDLPNSEYSKMEPAIRELGLKSYLGHVIKASDVRIGVLCVGYGRNLDLSDDQIELIKIIASALGNVEMRREKEQLLVNSNKLLEDALAHLKDAQDEVISHERLSALGQMVSGIAHDFNNALMPILGISDLLLHSPELMEDKQQLRKDLEMIRHSASIAAKTVKSLKEFHRPASDDDFRALDLGKVIQDAVRSTEHAWKLKALEEERPIEMQVMTGPLPSTMGDAASLEDVISNLILNAVDAMPKGGIIKVRGWHEEGFLHVSVADNGQGMSAEVRAQCLEPFFTTKYASGTGMGLSRSYGIISRHGGTMTVSSAPGKGTEVLIKLIRRIPEDKGQAEVQEAQEPMRPSHLDIMVVDDDDRTRYLLEKILAPQARNLTLCSNGEDALATFKSKRPTLVITDKAMPTMDGTELAERMKAESPQTPIIMLTGYGDLLDPDDLPSSVDALLTKPITRQQLYETIERVMAN